MYFSRKSYFKPVKTSIAIKRKTPVSKPKAKVKTKKKKVKKRKLKGRKTAKKKNKQAIKNIKAKTTDGNILEVVKIFANKKERGRPPKSVEEKLKTIQKLLSQGPRRKGGGLGGKSVNTQPIENRIRNAGGSLLGGKGGGGVSKEVARTIDILTKERDALKSAAVLGNIEDLQRQQLNLAQKDRTEKLKKKAQKIIKESGFSVDTMLGVSSSIRKAYTDFNAGNLSQEELGDITLQILQDNDILFEEAEAQGDVFVGQSEENVAKATASLRGASSYRFQQKRRGRGVRKDITKQSIGGITEEDLLSSLPESEKVGRSRIEQLQLANEVLLGTQLLQSADLLPPPTPPTPTPPTPTQPTQTNITLTEDFSLGGAVLPPKTPSATPIAPPDLVSAEKIATERKYEPKVKELFIKLSNAFGSEKILGIRRGQIEEIADGFTEGKDTDDIIDELGVNTQRVFRAGASEAIQKQIRDPNSHFNKKIPSVKMKLLIGYILKGSLKEREQASRGQYLSGINRLKDIAKRDGYTEKLIEKQFAERSLANIGKKADTTLVSNKGIADTLFKAQADKVVNTLLENPKAFRTPYKSYYSQLEGRTIDEWLIYKGAKGSEKPQNLDAPSTDKKGFQFLYEDKFFYPSKVFVGPTGRSINKIYFGEERQGQTENPKSIQRDNLVKELISKASPLLHLNTGTTEAQIKEYEKGLEEVLRNKMNEKEPAKDRVKSINRAATFYLINTAGIPQGLIEEGAKGYKEAIDLGEKLRSDNWKQEKEIKEKDKKIKDSIIKLKKSAVGLDKKQKQRITNQRTIYRNGLKELEKIMEGKSDLELSGNSKLLYELAKLRQKQEEAEYYVLDASERKKVGDNKVEDGINAERLELLNPLFDKLAEDERFRYLQHAFTSVKSGRYAGSAQKKKEYLRQYQRKKEDFVWGGGDHPLETKHILIPDSSGGFTTESILKESSSGSESEETPTATATPVSSASTEQKIKEIIQKELEDEVLEDSINKWYDEFNYDPDLIPIPELFDYSKTIGITKTEDQIYSFTDNWVNQNIELDERSNFAAAFNSFTDTLAQDYFTYVGEQADPEEGGGAPRGQVELNLLEGVAQETIDNFNAMNESLDFIVGLD